MPRYLQKRRRRWYAVLELPRDLRKKLGKTRLVRSMATESLTEAERLVLPVIARWKSELDAVRAGKTSSLDKLASEWRSDYAMTCH